MRCCVDMTHKKTIIDWVWHADVTHIFLLTGKSIHTWIVNGDRPIKTHVDQNYVRVQVLHADKRQCSDTGHRSQENKVLRITFLCRAHPTII